MTSTAPRVSALHSAGPAGGLARPLTSWPITGEAEHTFGHFLTSVCPSKRPQSLPSPTQIPIPTTFRQGVNQLRGRQRRTLLSLSSVGSNVRGQPWLVWLSGLSAGLQTKRLLFFFPVRAHAWISVQVPSWGREKGNQ